MSILRRPSPFLLLLLAALGCAAPAPPASPLDAPLPRVTGEALSEREVTLPDELLGAAGTPARVVEVPCIVGFFPGVMRGFIRDGMRGNLPPEAWDAVVPLFGDDADRLAERLGSDRPELGRVLLLDAQGVVRRLRLGAPDEAAVRELDGEARALAR